MQKLNALRQIVRSILQLALDSIKVTKN